MLVEKIAERQDCLHARVTIGVLLQRLELAQEEARKKVMIPEHLRQG